MSLVLSYSCCSVAKSCPTLSDPIDCSMPGLPVLHHLLEFAQVHVHWLSDAIQPSHHTVKQAKHKRINTAWLHFCEAACCCSGAQSCPALCNPIDCSMPGLPVLHHLQEFAQTHIHWVSDAIQPSHPLLSPSPPAFHLSQHQGLFHWVGSSHQVAKVLELQLQHQSFQWIFRVDFL